MSDKLVSQAMFDDDGTVVEKPLFATEAERNGVRPKQLALGIGNGQRPLEALPMFANLKPTEDDDEAYAG